VAAIVIALAILGVHMHLNDPLDLIGLLTISTAPEVNGSDHDQGFVPVQVHGHDHGLDRVNIKRLRSRTRRH
jgi:hypothetical protein